MHSATFPLVPLPVYLCRSPIPFPLHCGQSLARLGAEVVGVDPSPENVAVASAHAKGDPLTRTIRYEATTAEELEARGAQTNNAYADSISLSFPPNVKVPAYAFTVPFSVEDTTSEGLVVNGCWPGR